VARELAQRPHIGLICGRYEGIDERVRSLADEEISIGDFVLSGGEPAALVIIDALVRLLPGALGGEHSAEEESFSDWLLEYPHYTRPRVFEGREVPEVLLSGDHERIRRWRRKERLRRTRLRRPDLLAKARLSPEDERLLAELAAEGAADEEAAG
jgi:tRNA (guanine37-N1)-methyltransferase